MQDAEVQPEYSMLCVAQVGLIDSINPVLMHRMRLMMSKSAEMPFGKDQLFRG